MIIDNVSFSEHAALAAVAGVIKQFGITDQAGLVAAADALPDADLLKFLRGLLKYAIQVTPEPTGIQGPP